MTENNCSQMESLQRNLESLAREQGADYFGVADLAPARKFIEAQGGRAVVKPGEVPVLVIDGKPVVADLLKRVAEQTRSGIVVREFQEVGDALIESGVRRPDLIVIDTATPFFDGVGLLRLLRSNPHTQSSKILAMTDSADNIDQLRAYGATLVLVKPFGYNDLAEKLSTLFPLQVQLPS